MQNDTDYVTAERARVQAEYQRRGREIDGDLYAPWNPTEMFMRAERRRVAATMLHNAGVFPRAGDSCFEVGYGTLGWLGDLLSWGVRQSDLSGMELDPLRATVAQDILPLADLRVGDATTLPWEDSSFKLIVASTVFSSILDEGVRHLLSKEITRVLEPGGVLLWYDLGVNNPKNRAVKRVRACDLKLLFPELRGEIRSITLAPPLSRFVTPRSLLLANLLETISVLRTHLLAVLIKTF